MSYTGPITILCAELNSHYKEDQELDIYDITRDAFTYRGTNPVIGHPPCQQWSSLRNFANYNLKEKLLLDWCYEYVLQNGGILEHPLSSQAWKRFNIKPISVNQKWWGHKCVKPTGLFFNRCTPLAHPLNFDATTHCISGSKKYRRAHNLKLHAGGRNQWKNNITPPNFNEWLITSIKQTFS